MQWCQQGIRHRSWPGKVIVDSIIKEHRCHFSVSRHLEEASLLIWPETLTFFKTRLLFDAWQNKRKKILFYYISKIQLIFPKLFIFKPLFNVRLYWIMVISIVGCLSKVTFMTDLIFKHHPYTLQKLFHCDMS